MRWSSSVTLLALVACAGDDPTAKTGTPGTDTDTGNPTDTDDTDPPTDTDVDTGIPTTDRPDPDPTEPCDVPLVATVSQPGVLAEQSLRVEAVGGVGPYVFSLEDNVSGGFINEVSGSYFAGPTSGVTDVVRVDDTTCKGSATVDVEVFLPLEVLPSAGTIPTNTSFTLEISEGSGSTRCEPLILASGGSLAGCDYTSGGGAGPDTLRVVDELTGEVVLVGYDVLDGGEFEPWGATWLLPMGHPQALRFVGGTGIVDAVPDEAFVVWDGTLLVGTAEGSSTVAITDRFTGQTTSIEVVVAAPRVAENTRDGESTDWDHVVGGDLNDDGYDDAVVALMDAGVESHLGGGVFVYLGGPGGLDPEPAQSFGFDQPYAYGARSLALGDLDGDGVLDLAYGANGYDLLPDVDVGLVLIHKGVAGGTFDPNPTWSRTGTYGSDNFGYGLEICDVDGNGIDDLVVAAFRGEDREASTITYDTGAVHVFSGNPGGPSVQPIGTVYGEVPQGSGWVSRNVGLGHDLEGGDIDGDGRCDIAVSTYTESLIDGTDHGLVWVYTAGSLLSGGRPERIYTRDGGADTSVLFGVDIELGDVDDDGLDDLLVGARNDDDAGVISTGSAFLFLAADDDGRMAREPVYAAEASWTVVGDSSYGYLGWGVALGDLDGDGFDDVWVGAPSDELPKGTSNTGTVLMFDGATIAGSSLGTVVTAAETDEGWSNESVGSFFGTGIEMVGDVDGDGALDAVASASRDDWHGDNATSVYALYPGGVTERLEVPANAVSSLLGNRGAAAFVEVTGDGNEDLVGGAWSQPDETLGYNAGAVLVWADDGNEVEADPSESWSGHLGHSANDRYGFAVASAGDFDNDGREDLVVSSWNENKAATFDPLDVANAYECPGQLNGVGVALVHRGRNAGTDPDPAFAIYAYDAYAHIDQVAGGFDFDNDGFDDLVLGSVSARSEGGVVIARGRNDASLITVVCDADHVLGVSSNSRLGVAVANAGDLNGDGCDDVAVGADADDLGFSNQGSVRILWGDGAGCVGPAVTTLAPGVSNVRFGDALAAGQDIDHDGIPDLAVGGYDWEVGGVDHGGVWMLSGAWIAGLSRQSTPGWVLPSDGGTTVHLVTDEPRLEGRTPHGEYGRGVALVLDPDNLSTAWVAVGSRYGELGGADFGGGVELWDMSGGSFGEVPAAVVTGESTEIEGWLGESVAGHPTEAALVVGGPYAHVDGIDRGVLYPFWLP